ncbi:MAG: HAD family phosphatase [Candidatus Cloacimonadota bacterium]|nr:HAD family phosphatase [Candidatus Cloacimonadota bacterium]
MKKNKFEAIIFDLGQVVIDVQPSIEYWSEIMGVNATEFGENFLLSGTYHAFEKGLISPAKFRDDIRNFYKIKFSAKEFDRGWNEILIKLVDGIDELITNLKDQYRLVVLSNTNEIHIPVFEKRFRTTMEKFEKKFYSCRIQARKPEQKAFTIVLDYLQIESEKILFLDDKPENIEQAGKSGIRGIVVENFKQMKEELVKLGVI